MQLEPISPLHLRRAPAEVSRDGGVRADSSAPTMPAPAPGGQSFPASSDVRPGRTDDDGEEVR